MAVVFTLHDDKDYKIVFGDPEVISQHSSVVRLGIAGGDWELYGVDLSMNALIARQAAIRRGAEIFTLIFFTLFAWYALSRFQMRGLLNQTESARIGSERQFYHLIQEASADPIFVHDIDGKILEVNDRACCALGYSREELLTMSVLDFEISRSKLEGRKMLRKIELNTVTVLRSKHRRKDGSVFPAEVHLGAIDTLQGIRLIGVTRDITAQRNYENQLERLNADKNKFFSIIAHDLKGPLSGFLGLTEMLATDSESFSKDDLKCLGSEMNKSGRSLFKLLEDLLDWSQSQMGKITYQPEIFDIATVIKENISLQSTAANQKEIRLLFEDWGAYPVLADKDMLATVIRNLISNALKFTPRGGRVSILVKNRNDKIHVSFQDTGIGMNEEQINRLFKIDTANRRQGTEKEKGTGLGLLLCYELIAQNKGEIKIESKPDKGSTFTFTLPVG